MASTDPNDLTTRPASSSLYRYRFDSIEFDESANELRLGGQVVQVERIPLRLLSELVRSPNEVVTRAELFESVWEGRPTVDHVLANAVNKLRNALREEAAQRIVNIPRVGYRFNGPIERTAVGRHTVSAWPMEAGQPVPGRDGYVLERSLGSAPQSPVWLAREARLDEPRVFKFAVDGDRLSALKREHTLYRVLRQELGERPDFARIVGANFSTAPYFLECEYAGPDLRAWAAEGDRLVSLPMAERIALFLQIARAVMAAHSVGVLHKDLKPANVLVAPAPSGQGWIAKLTDFGSARLLEPGRLAELGVTAMGLTVTQGISSGDMSGTPLYLAPEILSGHPPTTQSDLYALGLMLYQLVVGDLRRPLATGWQRDIDDELLVEDITSATEGRSEDRLNSVAEFAERLSTLERRRLEKATAAEEAARADELKQFLQKARVRKPWVQAALSCLLIGLAASLWFYTQARTSLRVAERESARAKAINDFLNTDVLQASEGLRGAIDKPVLMIEVLQKALANVPDRFKGEPELEAAVRHQMAKTLLRFGHTPDAKAQFLRAIDLLGSYVQQSDPLLLRIQLGLADMYTTLADPNDPALNIATRTVEQIERNAGPALLSEKTELAFLATKVRFQLERRLELTVGGPPIGQKSLPIGLRMLSLAESVTNLDAGEQLDARRQMAQLYFALADTKKAEALLEGIAPPGSTGSKELEVNYARARMELAEIQRLAGQTAKTESELLALKKRLPQTLGMYSVQYGLVEFELARLYRTRGDISATEKAYRLALSAFQASLGDQHQYSKITALNIAAQLVDQGKAEETLQMMDPLEPWLNTGAGRANRLVAAYIRAMALTQLRRPREALALLQPLPDREQLEGDSFQWRIEEAKGHALLAMGRKEDGLAAWRASVASGKRNPMDIEEVHDYRRLVAELARAEVLWPEPAKAATAAKTH